MQESVIYQEIFHEGEMIPKLRGTNIQVKTLFIAVKNWRLTPKQVADEY